MPIKVSTANGHRSRRWPLLNISSPPRQHVSFPPSHVEYPDHVVRGLGESSVEKRCNNCESPDSSLLRVVLIGEIVRAKEPDLYALAEMFNELGLLEPCEDDHTSSEGQPTKRNLHRIK